MHKKELNEMTLPLELSSTPGIKEWAGRYSSYYRYTDEFIREMLQDKANGGYMTQAEC